MAPNDAGLWLLAALITSILGGAFRVIQLRIAAKRDVELMRMALEGTEPRERARILDGVSKLRPFCPTARFWRKY